MGTSNQHPVTGTGMDDDAGDGDHGEMPATCAVCGGDLDRVNSEVVDGDLVVNVRCKGECRQGGALVGITADGAPRRRVGPIFRGLTPALLSRRAANRRR